MTSLVNHTYVSLKIFARPQSKKQLNIASSSSHSSKAPLRDEMSKKAVDAYDTFLKLELKFGIF